LLIDHPPALYGFPNQALAVQIGTYRGLPEYLSVYGAARTSQGGAAEIPRRLAHFYMGPHVVHPPEGDDRPGYVTHVIIDRIAGVGPWADED
jgi:hypothetical protein